MIVNTIVGGERSQHHFHDELYVFVGSQLVSRHWWPAGFVDWYFGADLLRILGVTAASSTHMFKRFAAKSNRVEGATE